jgi:hypothetical protein
MAPDLIAGELAKARICRMPRWEINMETFRYLESRLGLEGGNDPEDMPDAGGNSRGIGERGSF